MYYWGKLLGVISAIVFGLGFWGVVFGWFIGHMIDTARRNKHNQSTFEDQTIRQRLFFRTTFQVMGHLTKSKGQVTKADIKIANLFMEHLQLHGEARIAAQQAFREGKHRQFPLRKTLRQLQSICCGRYDLIRMFLDIQFQAAFYDGLLHPNERQVLYIIAEELGISHVQFDQFLRMMEGQRRFDGDQNSVNRQKRHGRTLEDAYKVLGVDSHDNAAKIKRAYYKLMNEHHPDKLVAKGLPPQMMDRAKQKVQGIQAAYDLIKHQKGF